MKEIIDKHFNAVSLIVAIGAIVVSFHSNSASVNARIESAAQNTNARIDAIHAEIKDFHGRLCAIEERHSKLNRHA